MESCRRVLGSVIVLCLLRQATCQAENAKSVCKLQTHLHNENVNRELNWHHVSHSSTSIKQRVGYNFTACCDGYVHITKPECSANCPSGSCVCGYCPPDDEKTNCNCYLHNFYPQDDSECLPVCEVSGGQDSCTCHPGYSKDKRTSLCVPTECFARCDTGLCDFKGTCWCNGARERNSWCLQNICMVKCFNGMCNGNGTCACDDGYKNVNFYACDKISCPSTLPADYEFCKKRCESQCTNGSCTDEGRCNCYGGFQTDSQNYLQCNKISCPSSDSDDNVFCKKQCESQCINGNCTDEGRCNCNYGFIADLATQYHCKVIECPSQSERSNDHCLSTCTKACELGLCNNQGVCSCNDGYVKSPTNHYECTPVCKTGCGTNEVCSGPDSCSCAAGFIEIASSGNCARKCTSRRDCAPGICSSNDGKCVCSEGYRLDATNECIAKCTPDCVNGNCTGPNECSCNEGFVLANGSCSVDECDSFVGCSVPWIVLGGVGTLICLAIVAGVVAMMLIKRYNDKVTYRPRVDTMELHLRIQPEDKPESDSD